MCLWLCLQWFAGILNVTVLLDDEDEYKQLSGVSLVHWMTIAWLKYYMTFSIPYHVGPNGFDKKLYFWQVFCNVLYVLLTHWGRVTQICVSILTIIGSDNGLSPGRRQAIKWTNAGILSIGPPGTISSEILIRIQTFSFKKRHFKMSSVKWHPFCLSLNVLNHNRFRQRCLTLYRNSNLG